VSARAPAEREARARALLAKVGLDDDAMHKYPHEFSAASASASRSPAA
jgi:ABC-type microcin C transport system duplicated ATPase subunit YejF